MHTHPTPFLGQQSAPTPTHPPIRLLQAALPHWTRPLIRPTDRPRVYQVRSASRADLTHEVDMIRETCGCESWIFQNREAYPVGHDLRACCHIKDVEDWEQEHGLNAIRLDTPDAKRFWSKVSLGDGCWNWQAASDARGYGGFHRTINGVHTQCMAHRVAYELLVGPIPDGLELDHLCRNPRCVNPHHLEAVTHRVNALRGISSTAKNAVKTHCDKGHPFDERNTYWTTNQGLPSRRCRECRKFFQRKLRRKRRENSTLTSVEDYEREQAGIALTAVAEIARCVVCGAPAVPGGIHCRVTSWGRGYCAQTTTRARQAVDELCGAVV
jgi:hypothetical protein